MKRRNTMTAAVFLLAVSAGFLLLATSFFGGEGKFEACSRPSSGRGT